MWILHLLQLLEVLLQAEVDLVVEVDFQEEDLVEAEEEAGKLFRMPQVFLAFLPEIQTSEKK